MNTYYGYLDAEERASLIEETKIENELSRLETMYEMVELKLKQMENDVHLKVLTEAGTYDDYAYLMVEAEAAVAEEKKGILSTIWKALKDFFTTIGNAFRGLSKKGDPNDELKVSEQDMKDIDNASEKVSGIINGINQIKTGIQNHSKDQVISGAKAVMGSPIVISATVAGGVVGGYKVIKRQVLQGKCDQFAGLVDKVTDIINQIEQSAIMQWLQSAGVKIVNDVKSALNSIKTGLSTLKSKITSILTGTKTDDENNNQPQNNGGNGGNDGGKPGKPKKKVVNASDGYIYTIFPNGKVDVKDKNGNKINIDSNKYPSEVQSALHENSKNVGQYNKAKDILGRTGNGDQVRQFKYNKNTKKLDVLDKSGKVIDSLPFVNPEAKDENGNVKKDAKGNVLTTGWKIEGSRLERDGGKLSAKDGTIIPDNVVRAALQSHSQAVGVERGNQHKAEKAKRESEVLSKMGEKKQQNDIDNSNKQSDAVNATDKEIEKKLTSVFGKKGYSEYAFNKVKGAVDKSHSLRLKMDKMGFAEVIIPTKDGEDKIVKINKGKDIDDITVQRLKDAGLKDSDIDTARKRLETARKAFSGARSTMKNYLSELDSNNKQYSSKYNYLKESELFLYDIDDTEACFIESGNLYVESIYDSYERLENDGYTIEETEDDVIFTPNSFNEITTKESIFGEFVESSIDDIIFEDRYEQELYDLAEKFANL